MKARLLEEAPFPNLQVFLAADKAGPVFSIVFKNRERRPGTQNFMLWLACMVAGVGFYWVLFDTELSTQYIGTALILTFGTLGVSLAAFLLPYTARRVVRLDFGRDELSVARGGKTEVTRKLSGPIKFTIEPHPRAEIERQKRSGKVGPLQKLHCLFGYFGRAGEKVLLVSRHEYPSRESLFEVGQAIQWVFELYNSVPAAAPLAVTDGAAQPARGIRPPLD